MKKDIRLRDAIICSLALVGAALLIMNVSWFRTQFESLFEIYLALKPAWQISTAIVLGALVWLGLFLVFREFVTWYWKINKIVYLLEKIEENTRKEKVE